MYKFTFANVGGSSRVQISTAEDIRHLGELDHKLWTVLSCPTTGLEIAEESLQLMDTDGDGFLHVNEVIATANWLCATLKDPQSLFQSTDEVAIDNIQDEALRAIAEKLGKANLATLDEKIASITIEEQAAPEAPYAADVMAAYKAKQEEYTHYFELEKLQQMGLATIAEDMAKPGMTEADFLAMGQKIADYDAAVAAVNTANSDALTAAKAEYEPLRKLLLLSRDFITLLHNYVTLEDFYAVRLGQKEDRQLAIFQAGTLVIDQRACHLCIRVRDMGKHDAQAALSGIFLLYCECTNKVLGKTMMIAAAVTMGEIRNLTVGKNAIFYDRDGHDWDAVIVKIVDNPISIRQAFWSPYRKFANWVSELINKSASEKNDKAFSDMTAKVQAQADATTPEEKAAAKPQAFDIAKFAGIFAAIGMAVGYIGGFFTALGSGLKDVLSANHGIVILLGIILGIMLVISGPSMIMAWMKLRKRNLSPLLNANGWAVNADAIISVPFGATLTDQAQFPLLKLKDPFQKKGMPEWQKWLISIVVILAAAAAVGYILYRQGIINF